MSRFLLPTFLCGRQRKVGAAPHRGNANRPIRNQGKAKKNARKGQRESKERPKTKEEKAKNQNNPSAPQAKKIKKYTVTTLQPATHHSSVS
ncbi:hypothetical protein [Paraburkholderia sp. DHOC27]|uniref:hypothetical protein n=1 Tax=Paraburkholderia sp. DHOC27 TaxID=2303330 RepID=UPI0011C1CA18|nr:hypothetical protein [Paraburkholderia sp. DHOC27]